MSNRSNINIVNTTQGQNVGTGSGIYKCKNGNNLVFKSISATGGSINIITCDNQLYLSGNSGISGVAWGGITGTLSGQTDLNNCLNARVLTSSFTTYTDTTAPNQFASKSFVSNYTGVTAPNQFASKSFVSNYTGTTVPNTYLSKGTFAAYTGTTVPNTYYNKTQINSYTGQTAPIINNAVTGMTNLGSGNCLYTSKSGRNLQIKSLSAGTGISISNNANVISISSTSISGVAWGDITGNITGQTDLKNCLNSKQATITGGATSITSSDLLPSRALISDSGGKVTTANTTSTDIAYLFGVTGSVQTQLNNRVLSTTFDTYTDTTAPNTYYNKTQINSYSAKTNTLINSKIPKVTGATIGDIATFATGGVIQDSLKTFITTVNPVGVATDNYIPTELAVRNAINQVLNSVVILQGDWNANANTPNLQVTGITTGFAWRVSVSGTTSLGGLTPWHVGDLAIKSASGWIKLVSEDIAAIWGNIGGSIANQTDLVNALAAKLNTSAFSTYSGTTAPNQFASKSFVSNYTGVTAPNTYLSKSSFATYSGTTVPNTYYNKTQINSYTGQTLININNRMLTSTFNTWSGTTLPNTYLKKSTFATYTGTTAPNQFASKSFVSNYTGVTAPNTYLSKSSFATYSGTTVPNTYYNKTQINSYTGQTAPVINSAVTGMTNLGSGFGTLFTAKSGRNLQLKTLSGGTNVTLTCNGSYVGINVANTGEVNTASNLGLGSGLFASKSASDLQFKSLSAGTGIVLSNQANTVTICSTVVGGVAWGSITGTLSGQTDLNNCLNTRLTTASFATYSGTTVPNTYYNKTQINSYTGQTLTNINNRMLTSTFNNWSGTTLPNTYLKRSTFATYTGTTVPNTYYNKIQINSYTGQTAPIINNAVTGMTNLGTGNGTLFTAKSGRSLPIKTLSGGTNVTLTCNGNYVGINVANATGTDLSTVYNGNSISVNSSTGNDASLTGATTTSAGLITTSNQTFAGNKTAPIWSGSTCLVAPRIKLTTGAALGCILCSDANGLASWATPVTSTNLSTVYSAASILVCSDTGSDASLTGATATLAGIVTTSNQTFSGVKTTPTWCGSTSVKSQLISGTTTCGSTAVCGGILCGTSCVETSIVKASTYVCSPIITGSTCLVSPQLKLTNLANTSTTNILFYDTVSKSVSYSAAPTGTVSVTGVTNLGGGNGVIACTTLSNNNIQLKTLSGGTNVTLTCNGNYIAINAAGGGATNLSTVYNGTSISVNSDTGSDASLTGATATLAGLVTTSDQTFAGNKIAPIWSGSTCILSPKLKVTNLAAKSTENKILYVGAGGLVTSGCSNICVSSVNNVYTCNTSLPNLTSGINNTYIGSNAGCKTTTGIDNIGIGLNSLCSNTTGSQNIGLGYETLAFNTGGTQNIAMGQSSLRVNTKGSYNVAVGGNSMANNVSGCWNNALGFQTLQSNTTGCRNTALGHLTLQNNTIGHCNTAVGADALRSNTTGSNNVGVGKDALQANTYGGNNVAVGTCALNLNTGGTGNIGVGFTALYCNRTGSNNVAVGNCALGLNISGHYNNAVGYYALQSNTTGCYNIANGYLALKNNTTGFYNIASGYQALSGNTIGCSNVAIGYQTLHNNITGSTNIAIGSNALHINACGHNNVGIGNSASYSNLRGCNNVAMGVQAGYLNSTGSTSVYLGYNAGYNETKSNRLYIANSATNPLIYGEFDTQKLKVCGRFYVGGLSASTKTNSIYYDTVTKELSYGAAPSGSNNVTGATNLGSGNGTLYTSVSANNIQLKTLSGGTNVTLTCNGNYIAINATGGGGGISTANNGLTVNGTNVRLGGSLTGDTCISGVYSMTFGSRLGTVGAQSYAFGNNNCAIGDCSFAFGNSACATVNAEHAIALSSSAQSRKFIVYSATTNTTPTLLHANTDFLLLPTSTSAWAFTSKIVGMKSDGTTGAFFFEGAIRRNSGGTVALVDVPTKTSYIESALAGINVALIANDTRKSLDISVTGLTATNISWVGTVDVVQFK